MMQSKAIVKDIYSIDEFNPDKINILLYHEPKGIDKIRETGVDLMLAGHTHRGQMWPFNFITSKIYNGYDYGLYQEGEFNLYVSSGAGIWGPTMRTSAHSEIVVFDFKNIEK